MLVETHGGEFLLHHVATLQRMYQFAGFLLRYLVVFGQLLDRLGGLSGDKLILRHALYLLDNLVESVGHVEQVIHLLLLVAQTHRGQTAILAALHALQGFLPLADAASTLLALGLYLLTLLGNGILNGF